MPPFSFHKLKRRWKDNLARQSERADLFKDRLLQRGAPVFRHYGVERVYLFGSVASGRCSENSDIDIYVTQVDSDAYWRFKHDLEEAVQLPIDIYTDHDDPVFVKKIIERGELVYGL